MKGEIMDTSLSRRSFVAGGALAAGVLATGAGMALAEEGSSSEPQGTPTQWGQYSFEIAPDPVPDDQIVQEYETEVLVCGAGIAGAAATHAALEEGAQVMVIQKNEEPMTHGIGIFAINTKLQKASGAPDYDPTKIAQFLFSEAYGYGDYDIIENCVNHSAVSMDMIIDLVSDRGWGEMAYTGDNNGDAEEYTGATSLHGWMDVDRNMGYDQVPLLTKRLFTVAEEKGATILYSTPLYMLERDADGRACAAIASTEAGYIRVKASKGIILATGDIENDPEMVAKYAPFCQQVLSSYLPATNTGDGQKAALWAGAKLNDGPWSQAIHFDPSGLPAGDAPLSGSPYLAVNAKGVRYQNEDVDYPIIANTCARQPGGIRYQVMDEDAFKSWEQLDPQEMCRGAGFMYDDVETGWEASIEKGAVYKADSLEELAGLFGFDEEATQTFLATCERYQELVEAGVDEDFGKDAKYMPYTSVKNPPFYGVPRAPAVLMIANGVLIDKYMQAMDTNYDVIPGLFAAGNCCGQYFGVDYTLNIGGVSIGHAIQTGYIAGKSACGVFE